MPRLKARRVKRPQVENTVHVATPPTPAYGQGITAIMACNLRMLSSSISVRWIYIPIIYNKPLPLHIPRLIPLIPFSPSPLVLIPLHIMPYPFLLHNFERTLDTCIAAHAPEPKQLSSFEILIEIIDSNIYIGVVMRRKTRVK